MSIQVPILRQGTYLIASVQDALSDKDILLLQSRLLAEVVRTRAKGVVIDVSSLDVLDSFGTRMLCDMAAAAQLRGALTVIVGIQPEVALSMVLLGLTMRDVATALDLDAGLDLLHQRVKS
jgi:rsbT antagonist protein RsbS